MTTVLYSMLTPGWFACGARTLRPSCLAAVQVMEQITESLYEQTMDAQEGVIYYLLDQMTEQHIKEVLVAYFILLSSGAALFRPGSSQE